MANSFYHKRKRISRPLGTTWGRTSFGSAIGGRPQLANKKYARYKDKNLNQLMEFSKVARVEEKVRRYMEVLI